jgi:Flp pilus assembly protein TadD
MNSAQSVAAASRLERLAGYLKEDPGNAPLLADACEVAIACGQHARADAYIDSARRLGLDPQEWKFRSARLAIARRELDQAAELLQQLGAGAANDPVLAHDLAHVRLLQGQFEACRSLVEPWIGDDRAGELTTEQLQALQVLWLRAAHRLGSLPEALDWAKAQAAAGTLQPAARGAASLIAVDIDEFAAAGELADAALAADGWQVEALVARASVAMAGGDSVGATHLLQRALESNPDDGRTWSMLGFASLQAQNLPLAASQLERAVCTMPDHIGTWHALGWTRLLQGDRAGALAAFRQALDLDRNFAESHGALGLVLAMNGDLAEADRHLELADRLDPRNVTGRYARALRAGEAGDAAKLNALARQLLDRPGFFGGSLGEMVDASTRRRPG